MKIVIEEWCDGFQVTVDDDRWSFTPEEGLEALSDVFKRVNPLALVEYEEAY